MTIKVKDFIKNFLHTSSIAYFLGDSSGQINDIELDAYLAVNLDNLPQELDSLLEDELPPQLLDHIANDSRESLKLQAWIIILAKHRNFSPTELKTIASKLKIAANDQVRFAYSFDRLDFVEIQTATVVPSKNDLADIYVNAAFCGFLDVIKHLDKNFEKIYTRKDITLNATDLLVAAANGGHLPVIEHLGKRFLGKPSVLSCQLSFITAAQGGYLHILEYFQGWTQKYREDFTTFIAIQDCEAFKGAVNTGNIEVMQYLERHIPGLRYKILWAQDTQVFGHAIKTGDVALINYLLESPAYFKDAADHDNTAMRPYLRSFIGSKILCLRDVAPVDVDPGQALLLYEMVKYLIKLNDPEFNAYIGFILTIPTVRTIAHNNGRHDEENALLILALQREHQVAIAALRAIPEVERIAQIHRLYDDRVGNRRALRDLMNVHRTFTPSENRMINNVRAYYAPKIGELGGADAVIQQLLNYLKAEYMANVAIILGHIKESKPIPKDIPNYGVVSAGDGRQIILPFDNSDIDLCIDIAQGDLPGANMLPSIFSIVASPFDHKSLTRFLRSFNADTKEKILGGYYANPLHAAYRYFLEPNPFISDKAHWGVEWIDENNKDLGKRSFFKQSISDITVCYLGAIDTDYLPMQEGNTIQARFTRFAEGIAALNQGHSKIEAGKVVEGDNPSCKPGSPAYILGLVQDHPLFTSVVDKDKIVVEYKAFILEYYRNTLGEINFSEILELNTAAEEILAGGNTAVDLVKYNIKPEDVEVFLAGLKDKYKEEFTSELEEHTITGLLPKEYSSHISAHMAILYALITQKWGEMSQKMTLESIPQYVQEYVTGLGPVTFEGLRDQWKLYLPNHDAKVLHAIAQEICVANIAINVEDIKVYLTDNEGAFGNILEKQVTEIKNKRRAVNLGIFGTSVAASNAAGKPEVKIPGQESKTFS
jgi:uncharacterized protein YfkK (UPF0435 family)